MRPVPSLFEDKLDRKKNLELLTIVELVFEVKHLHM